MTGLTSKGAATRQRIVATAADLVLDRGVEAATLDEICAATSTSRSQLFHYFPTGKSELVAAISMFQGGRVLEAQRPHLDELDTWRSWDAWRSSVVAHYARQRHLTCPITALAGELLGHDPGHSAVVASYMDEWQRLLDAGVARMVANGRLRRSTDVHHLAVGVFAALQGGLVLMQRQQSLQPLEAALDAAIAALRSASSHR